MQNIKWNITSEMQRRVNFIPASKKYGKNLFKNVVLHKIIIRREWPAKERCEILSSLFIGSVWYNFFNDNPNFSTPIVYL